MPVTDALLTLHGTGATYSGPITSTAKSFTGSIATTGVLTITAGASGAALLVGDVLTGANIAVNPCIVTGITTITAAVGVGTYTVSAPQLATSATILASPPLLGDLCGATNATSAYSNLELDFGPPLAGTTSYPYLSAFPSLTEKDYTFPPEVVGAGGVQVGLHIMITGPFYGNATATVLVEVASDATTAATTVIASRTFTVAQLRVQGAHYFIPVNPMQVKEFLRFNWTNNTGYTYVGNIVAYFGPVTGGCQ